MPEYEIQGKGRTTREAERELKQQRAKHPNADFSEPLFCVRYTPRDLKGDDLTIN
jgi:hypothetical protein